MNPDVKTFIEQMLAGMADAPAPAAPPTLDERRAMFDGLMGMLAVPLRPVHEQREIQIPGPRGDIRA